MKIRNGFVSNSSSSSFVLLTTKENLENVTSSLDEEQVKMFDKLKKHIMNPNPINTFGKELYVFETWDHYGESPFMDLDDFNYDADESPTENLWNRTIKPLLLKNNEESFSYTFDG